MQQQRASLNVRPFIPLRDVVVGGFRPPANGNRLRRVLNAFVTINLLGDRRANISAGFLLRQG